MVVITARIPQESQAEVADIICETVRSVPSITPRSKRQILSALRGGDMALAFADSKLVGWLLAIPYSDHLQELGMAYIVPDHRDQGILHQLIAVLIDKRALTLAVTYDARLAQSIVDSWSFRPSSLLECLRLTSGRFIVSRFRSPLTVWAVVSHVASAQPMYLLRDSHENR